MAEPDKDAPWGAALRQAQGSPEHGRGAADKRLSELALEGGQGFLPTHEITEVQQRLVRAAAAGAREYCRNAGAPFKQSMVETTFEKLHNDAFARRPDSPAMKAAIYACQQAGIWKDEPIIGWNVSCDARIFAKQFPQRDIITFGPGSLAHAHSPEEQISVTEIISAAKMMAIFALALCEWGRAPR
jgi:acetylornithine deacetylase/succinyl-diaminopimelate desuccinylase-like protein